MGRVKEIVRRKYVDEDEGFEFTFMPEEDTIHIVKLKDGTYQAHYLVRDNDPFSPSQDEDDNLFLVHYHRDFWITRDKIITQDDARNWYRQDFEDYVNDPDDEEEVRAFPLAKDYHIFAVSALIHSGVWLSLNRHFNADPQGWDTSHVGLMLVAREEWPDEVSAYKAALGHIEMWNQYLSGDVWAVCVDYYDSEKELLDNDACWGFYGYKYAMQEIKETVNRQLVDGRAENARV